MRWPAHGKHSFPVYEADRPRASTTPACRCAASLSALTRRCSASFGATRCFSRARAFGPYVVFAYDWVATAPTPARAKGTTAPTATNFDSTAMPRSFVLGSNPTMLKVDGRGRGMGRTSACRLFSLPAKLKRNPQLRRGGLVRPVRHVWRPPRSREDVPRISRAVGGSPGRTLRRFTRRLAAGARRGVRYLYAPGERNRLEGPRVWGGRRRARRAASARDVRASRHRCETNGAARPLPRTRTRGAGPRQRAVYGRTIRDRMASGTGA